MFSYFSAPRPENSLQTLRNYCIRAWASSSSWQPGLQSPGVPAPAQASSPSLSWEPGDSARSWASGLSVCRRPGREYYTILYHTLYSAVLYYTTLYTFIVLFYHTLFYYTILHYIILLYHTICYSILNYTTLYYTVLYCTQLYCAVRYCTVICTLDSIYSISFNLCFVYYIL